jgi:ubiquinone/menaquinone biosynthesis C-methylase UbiE
MEPHKIINPDTFKVKEVYEKIAEHFNEKRFSKWDWVEEFLDQFPTNSLVYDIGCGSGRNIRPGMIGVDNCDNFLKISNSKGKDVIKGDMINLPLDDNTGIGMICIAAFHHLSTRENRLKALLEFKRVLKIGAKIMISVWSINQTQSNENKGNRKLTFYYGDNIVPWNNNGTIYERYYYIFEDEEIKKLFQEAGLRLVKHFWNHGNEIYILQKDF